jgi:glycopeptide antibiotics resistance protein
MTGPAIIVAAAFHFALAHRSDYLGHYLAGFGGTLMAMMLLLAAFERMPTVVPSTILLACVASIAFGAALESTVFRIGRFDEVDFFNQSLGAVLAALVALRMSKSQSYATTVLAAGLAVSLTFLIGGFWFAFK